MIQLLHNINAILNRAERRQLRMHVLYDAIMSILDIGALLLLILIINFYTQPTANTHLSFLPSFLLNKDSILLIAVFFIVFCVKNGMAYLLHRSQFRFVYRVASRLSEIKLLQFLRGKYDDYVSIDSSVNIRKISQQPIEFSQHVLAGIQQIITQTFLIIVTVIAILIFNVKLFFILLVLLVPPVIAIAYLIKKRIAAARKNVKKSGERSLQHLREALAGYVESKIYDKETFFTKRYTGFQRQLNDHLAALQIVQGMPGRLMEVFAVLGFLLLMLISKSGDGNADILTIGLFMAAAYKIIPGVVKILNSSGQVRTYDYTIKDLAPDATITKTVNIIESEDPIRSVECRNISFNHDHQKILSQFSCMLRSGELAGISGISGKGKTTLANLLLGFVSAQEGEIFVNGLPADNAALQSLWKKIAYVKQDPFLINDSIVKNITLNEEHFNPTKMNAVIAATGLKELLGRHPEGWNKIVTENGKDISGGQKQRIAIARALYKDADLIILDEPFNELDSGSEQLLLQHLRALASEGKIILLITHNKESLAYCHHIIALDET